MTARDLQISDAELLSLCTSMTMWRNLVSCYFNSETQHSDIYMPKEFGLPQSNAEAADSFEVVKAPLIISTVFIERLLPSATHATTVH